MTGSVICQRSPSLRSSDHGCQYDNAPRRISRVGSLAAESESLGPELCPAPSPVLNRDALPAILLSENERLRSETRRSLAERKCFDIVGECTEPAAVPALLSSTAHRAIIATVSQSTSILRRWSSLAKPGETALIVVTDREQCAREAFSQGATDILLSPASDLHWSLAFERVRRYLSAADSSAQLPERQPARNSLNRRVCLKSDGRFVFLRLGDIHWVESDRNHVRVHVDLQPAPLVVRQPLQSFHAGLSHPAFVRIHKSVVVNRMHVRELSPWPTGEYVVTMASGKRLTLSRGFRDGLQALMSDAP